MNTLIAKQMDQKSMAVDSSNSVNRDWVQVLRYSKYFLLFLMLVGIEPATSQMISLRSTFQPNTLSTEPCVLGRKFRVNFWHL